MPCIAVKLVLVCNPPMIPDGAALDCGAFSLSLSDKISPSALFPCARFDYKSVSRVTPTVPRCAGCMASSRAVHTGMYASVTKLSPHKRPEPAIKGAERKYQVFRPKKLRDGLRLDVQ